MHFNLTASALATAALFCGAARTGAQEALRTLDTTFASTAALDLFGASATSRPDTSDVDEYGSSLRRRASRADTSSPDTSMADVSDASVSDTSTTDALHGDGADREDRDGGSSPTFFELRLVTARHSAVPTRMPMTEYRNLYIVDLRAGWTLTSNGLLSVEYAPSIVPLAISTRNPREYVPRASVNCVQGKDCANFTALDISTVPLYANTYGFGLTPLGFQLRLFRSSPVQLLTYANGGALWFTHRIPDPEATRFNFTAELGAAVQVNLPERLGLVVGYSWHHTSNGGTGHVNPGLNSRAISLGIVARRER
jgi:hypothetical protein